MAETLVILGASVRAAAYSAQRAGFAPWCADIFNDTDLAERFTSHLVTKYPQQLVDIAAKAPMGNWMYTGGVENYPDVIKKISAKRSLFGNGPMVLERVRDPKRFADALARGGLPFPAVNATAAGLPRDGSWLRKNRHSTGGVKVQIWDPRTTAPREDPDWYFQQRINGEACSAVFVAASGQAVLLGVTRQLVGTDWTGGSGFLYCGSMGPLELQSPLRSTFEQIGNQLEHEFGLVGLFGVDAVLAEGTVWPVEINPRYPASCEVLERALGIRTIEIHVDACRRGKLPEMVPLRGRRLAGKAVMYARKDATVGAAFRQRIIAENQGMSWPAVADIPAEAKAIEAGSPVTTVLGEAEDFEDLEKLLRDRVSRLEQTLYGK